MILNLGNLVIPSLAQDLRDLIFILSSLRFSMKIFSLPTDTNDFPDLTSTVTTGLKGKQLLEHSEVGEGKKTKVLLMSVEER